MSRTLHTDIEIQATADQVWEVLTDFAAYRDWNPFIVEASGTPRPGQRLRLRMRPAGGRETTFRPEVLEADPGRKLRWLGRLLIPGLFDGEHSFRIEPIGPDRIRLTQHEEFRGLLAPLLLARIGEPTRQGFHQMNQALKARVEQPASTRS
ncbi:MAG TPA: SRPBCC domain-containing protein [Actinomycetota bacterium]|nr:SRPBCC domain-containing protein [Actinomycetota bacterium]